MMSVQAVRYGIGKTVMGNFDEVVERVKTIFRNEGFGVITEIDLQKTLAEKTGEKIEPYVILGMCNPNMASKALAVEHEVGLLLPCNVIVHDGFGEVTVMAQDPEVLMKGLNRPQLTELALEAKERILRAIQML